MRTLAPGLHVHDESLRFFGIEVGARATVMETDTGVLLHSPLPRRAIEPGLSAVVGVDAPRWVVAPNRLHHLFVGEWIEAGCEAWAAPGLPEKRPDLAVHGVLTDAPPFGPDIGVFPLSCFAFTNEVVFLHRPSRTLVVTDLLFHFGRDAPWLTRVAMACAGGYPGCRTTLLERVGFDRPTARREIGALLELDFDRLVMAHGHPIESGGRAALRDAMRWLGL
jgi:hypothetical protein